VNKEQIKALKEAGIGWEMLKQGLAIQPKATYYKPDGTELPNLPADPYSLKRYIARGFLLQKPEIAQVSPDEHKCETCGKVCKTKLGLSGHMRSHAKN